MLQYHVIKIQPNCLKFIFKHTLNINVEHILMSKRFFLSKIITVKIDSVSNFLLCDHLLFCHCHSITIENICIVSAYAGIWACNSIGVKVKCSSRFCSCCHGKSCFLPSIDKAFFFLFLSLRASLTPSLLKQLLTRLLKLKNWVC